MELTDNDKSFIANALRVAAERYRTDAGTMAQCDHPVLEEQFYWQADKATAYAERFETED